MLEVWRASYKAVLENPMLDDPRIHHVRYPDRVGDPVGTIRGFCDKADVEFAPYRARFGLEAS